MRIWRYYGFFFFEADKRLFCDNFIIPVIEKKLNKIYREDEEEMTIAFLKEGSYNYNFNYSNDEERFVLVVVVVEML